MFMHHQPAFTCMLTYFVPCVGADLSAEKFLHANGSLAGCLSVAHCSTIGNSVSSGIGNSFCNKSVHDIIDKHVIWEPDPSVSEDSEVLPRDPLIPAAGSNFCSSGASHQLHATNLIDISNSNDLQMYSEFTAATPFI